MSGPDRFAPPPRVAAWRHLDARDGFEVVFPRSTGDGGWRVEGSTSAVEDGEAWVVEYAVDLDEGWRTRAATVVSRTAAGRVERRLEADGAGLWTVDGHHEPAIEGCVDVDLEASSCTNMFPIRRLALAPGETADAPAAYVRAVGLGVGRLDQAYTRVDDVDGAPAFDYESRAFNFAARLVYDRSGLVVDYPGLARRVV